MAKPQLAVLAARKGATLPSQIRHTIRRAVLAGYLRPGARLPSSRVLAAELGVSRNSVVDAYDQLHSEGYLEGRHGSGTFVAADLLVDVAGRSPATSPLRQLALSSRGRASASLETSHSADTHRPFSPGIPALDLAALASWFQTAARVRKRMTPELLNYGNAAGYAPLREAIAGYLGPTRGVMCGADQVVITAGTQQALSIAAHLLLDPDEPAWVEDPGYPGAAAALAGAGARLVHVAVDADGLDVAAGVRRAPGARLAYVSPSHQYPLGITMSLARRLDLLRWANQANAWILEDDYDSEFRYDGRTLPALQGLDDRGRVIYVGTFSKTLFPSLRIGYAIVPSDLAGSFA
ncbi:MAG: PLP-dependent aminotransferase family protein, partial [Thermoanaerobaculia bacterium]